MIAVCACLFVCSQERDSPCNHCGSVQICSLWDPSPKLSIYMGNTPPRDIFKVVHLGKLVVGLQPNSLLVLIYFYEMGAGPSSSPPPSIPTDPIDISIQNVTHESSVDGAPWCGSCGGTVGGSGSCGSVVRGPWGPVRVVQAVRGPVGGVQQVLQPLLYSPGYSLSHLRTRALQS